SAGRRSTQPLGTFMCARISGFSSSISFQRSGLLRVRSAISRRVSPQPRTSYMGSVLSGGLVAPSAAAGNGTLSVEGGGGPVESGFIGNGAGVGVLTGSLVFGSDPLLSRGGTGVVGGAGSGVLTGAAGGSVGLGRGDDLPVGVGGSIDLM